MTEREIIFLWLDHIAGDLGQVGTFLVGLGALITGIINIFGQKKAGRERRALAAKITTIATNVDGVVEKLSVANKTAGLAEGELKGRIAAAADAEKIGDAVEVGVTKGLAAAAADPASPITIAAAGNKPRRR